MERLVTHHFDDRIEKGEYSKRRELKHLPDNVKGRMLEIGCGTRLTYMPGGHGVCGVDISLKMAKHFLRNHPNAEVVLADARALPFRNDSFGVVIMNTVLHHLVGRTPHESSRNAKVALHQARRTLMHTGTLLILELVSRSRLLSLLMFYVTLLCAKLRIDIDLLDIHSRVVTYFLTQSDLEGISSDLGFDMAVQEAESWRFLKMELGRQITYALRSRI